MLESELENKLENKLEYKLETDLDRDYIKEFQLLEKDYNEFYNEDVNTVKIHYFYINEENEIYNIKSEYESLDASSLSKERIIYLIKKNQYNLLNKHKLIGLLKYNIDFDFTELNNFFSNKLDNNFLEPLKIINDIKFNKTISLLHDLNCIIFLFSNNILNSNCNSNTKKIHIRDYKSKTRRNNNKGRPL